MNTAKLELYDHRNHSGSNGLATLVSPNHPDPSVTPSESDSAGEDDQDDSRKRKRPMNVTYVRTPSRTLSSSATYSSLVM